MKRRIIVFVQIAMLLLMFFPGVAMSETSNITMSLSKTKASVGDSIIVSGISGSGDWVVVKVVDKLGNIILFDVTNADGEGAYTTSFIVPAGSSGILTVVVGEGSNVANKELDIKTNTSGSAGGGGGGGVVSQPVTSTTGSADVTPGAGGTVSLGDDVTIGIPANALTGTGAQKVKITRVSNPSPASAGFRLLGNVYEFRIGEMSSYNFDKKVTITLTFDPDELKPGETPAIYYYDENKQDWICLGGIVSGNTISVEVDHLTRFAVFAQEKAPETTPDLSLTDISGHWAEDNIRELVTLGAVSGYPDGTFKPDNKITRAEFTAIIVKAFDLAPRGGKVFADTVDHWASESIAIAATYEIVNGYDKNTFGPDEVITREQMAVMIVKAARLAPEAVGLTFEDIDSIAGWAKESMAAAVNHGIISGYPDNTVRPQGHATRAEAVTVIVNAL